MIRHIVLFRWNATADDAARESVSAGLSELPGQIDAIRSYRFGTDVGINEGNFEFGLVADFDDVAGYLAYRDHPVHQQFIADVISPILAERASLQFVTD